MRHRAIVKEVTRGFESDDSGETGNELARRGRLFADAWIDDETTLRTGIPIARSVARDFYVGLRTAEWYDRAWAEGDENTGLIIVENELGSPQRIEFTINGLTVKNYRGFWEAEESDYLLIKWWVISDNDDSEFTLRKNNSSVLSTLLADTAHTEVSDAFREDSGLLLTRLERGSVLSIGCTNAGVAANDSIATTSVVLREIPGT